jgi:hypothetical protein
MKMVKVSKKIFPHLSFVVFLFFLGTENVFSQPKDMVEKGQEIGFGEIAFLAREFESTPSPMKMLEIHVEVLNKSRRTPAPPNSIKVVVVPKEIKFPEETLPTEFNPNQEETTLTVALPPNTGRVLIFGFSLPEKKPESITFEIQINPPHGEKKTVKWEGMETK